MSPRKSSDYCILGHFLCLFQYFFLRNILCRRSHLHFKTRKKESFLTFYFVLSLIWCNFARDIIQSLIMFGKKRRWHLLKGQEPTEMDKKILYWENKGKLVPTRDLIKTPEQIEGIRKSGVVNTGVLD